MKKIFPLLLISIILSLFTSCVIIDRRFYSVTVCNESGDDICDWYIKDEFNNKYALSSDFCIVLDGYESNSKELPYGFYKICYSFIPNVYKETNYFYLTSNTKLYVYSKRSGGYSIK